LGDFHQFDISSVGLQGRADLVEDFLNSFSHNDLLPSFLHYTTRRKRL
jgi:hypothetical protein